MRFVALVCQVNEILDADNMTHDDNLLLALCSKFVSLAAYKLRLNTLGQLTGSQLM